MGNSQQRREELLQYQPHLINYTLHHTHSPLSIYRHLYSSQEIMEHREIIYHCQDIDRKLQTFYSRYQHLFLVSTQYLKLQAPNACSDGSYEMRTFYQRVITNLSKVNDIPYNDSLYCYSVALKGFEILFRSYGYFQVFENMFHICQQGKLKVWCNQHIYKSVPQQYLLGNGREEDMVMKVISIIDQNIERRNHQINIKQILMRVRPLTFANARSLFMEVCNQNQFFVTQYLESLQHTVNIQSILDIYVQYPSKNKLMQPYDTGLTFNPKKNSSPNFPRSSSQDQSVRRSSLLSSRVKNQTPSEKRSSFDQFNKKNKRIQIMNIAIENQNKQDGFPRFSNQTGRKSSWSQQNPKQSSQVYERIMSPYKFENKKELLHQVASNSYGNAGSPQSRLKKTASRQNGRAPNRILFQSSVNEIKDGQIRNSFNPQQDLNSVSQTNRQIGQDNQYYQSLTNQYNEPPRVYQPQQYVVVSPYSQNRRFTTEPQSSRTSQTKTIRVNLSPQPLQLGLQPTSPKWTNPIPQNSIIPPRQTIPSQQHNVMYPIYPVQKVMYQVQPESSRLRKATKIQTPITFSQQKSQNSFNNQSQMSIKQILPAAYVQHEKRAQMQFNQRFSLPIQQMSPVRLQNTNFNKNYDNLGINGGNISHKIISNNDFIQNNQIRIVDGRYNNQTNFHQRNTKKDQNMKFLPVNRRPESLPSKVYPYEKYNQLRVGNVAMAKELQTFQTQKSQNQDNTPKSRKFSEKSYDLPQPPKMEQREVKKDEKLQLPQIQSKIDMLSSFAENKINTFEFLPNQSHAISGIKWQKGQNSGRDSVSSAFRKELLPQSNSLRQFQRKPNSIYQQKNSEANKKQSNGIKANHDYLQTDPKLLELIKNATSNYKKELVKTVSIQNKQAAIVQSYGKKDSIKQYNVHQTQYRQSRFKTLPQKKQNTNQMSSLTAIKVQSSNCAYSSQRKTEVGAFKKKNQSYVSGNKISAISQKWDEQNICSTSNGSIGKNYLQNLDADILQDMYAYGMEGKGRFK